MYYTCLSSARYTCASQKQLVSEYVYELLNDHFSRQYYKKQVQEEAYYNRISSVLTHWLACLTNVVGVRSAPRAGRHIGCAQ